jgi:hypothetical protein
VSSDSKPSGRLRWLVLLSLSVACRAATQPVAPPNTVPAAIGETTGVSASSDHVDTLEELCEIMLAEFEDDAYGCSQGMCSCKPGPIHPMSDDGPWQAAALLDLGTGNDRLWVVELAIAEAGGWRRAGFVVDEEAAWTQLDVDVELSVDELEPSSPGDELRLDVSIRRTRMTMDDDEAVESDGGREDFVIVCGSADGGWCVTIPTELRTEGQSAPFTATLEFDGAGTVTIETDDPRWAGSKRLRELQPIDHFPWFEFRP